MSATDDHRVRALRRLPPTLAVAVRLSDAGATAEHIALLLDIEQAAVAPLLEVAQAKLVQLLRDSEPPSPPG